jgi:phosphatidylserine/phosphatidylglycerophosphate/cardiolipin synthase-like enzyme
MNSISRTISLSAALCLALVSAQAAWSIDVQVAEAPTTDLQLTVNAINSARESLLVNIYELSSPEIADALTNRIQAGVKVQILEEGQPVGGMSAASKGIVSQLAQAMQSASSEDHLYEMTSKAGGKRRYRYDHAKYVVIDEQTLLIGSENYSPTGNPQPGSVGNRGWEVTIQDADLARQFAATFASDTDTSHQDVMDVTSNGVSESLFGDDTSRKHGPKKPPVTPVPDPVTPVTPTFPTAPTSSDGTSLTASAIEMISSPDTSLSSITALLRSATTSIDIEQMSFDPNWGTNGPQSPLVDEVLAAARRGVKVRVLLNDETVFDHESKPSKPKNRVTIQTLNEAANQGLPIQALVANIKAMGVDYIHNKGVIVDGDRTLISSINWDENSFEHNRETAVLITSPDVFNHYEALFQHDWDVSTSSSAESARYSAENTFELDSANCPQAVSVSVDIGAITVDETADKSFEALSNQHYDLNMNRSGHACIFVTTDRTSRKKILEIRQDTHGYTVFALEGYTSAGKLYSIRAKTHAQSIQNSVELAATVYDASGPGREILGDANMSIRAQ